MRFFDRDSRMEAEEVLPWVDDPDKAVVDQAIDTVARRLITRRADVLEVKIDWEDFTDIGETDWEQVQIRVQELLREIDRGNGPFEAAYELLKLRAERET